MKFVYSLHLILLLLSIGLCAQTNKIDISRAIVGVWQENDSLENFNEHNYYRFYADGRFEYVFNKQDRQIGRVKISGEYKLKDSTIICTATSRTELHDGEFHVAKENSHSLWSFQNAKVITIQQSQKIEEYSNIRIIEGKKLRMFEAYEYFKISNSPNYKADEDTMP